jgi:hypothetical protein
MTLGVTAFSLLPLQAIVGDANATSLIDAQAKKIAQGNYSTTQKEKWDVIIQGLREPTKRGYTELVAFPGFFTSASAYSCLQECFVCAAYFVAGAPQPGKKYLTFTGNLHFPFSTGNIHISSTNPHVQPNIDPHYYEQDFGLQEQVF